MPDKPYLTAIYSSNCHVHIKFQQGEGWHSQNPQLECNLKDNSRGPETPNRPPDAAWREDDK